MIGSSKFNNYFISTILFAACAACSSPEEQLQSDLRRQNQKGEFIYRKSDEYFFVLKPPKQQEPPVYPWEKHHPKGMKAITKDYFRCKGSSLSPERLVEEEGGIKRYRDCGGSDKHGLPLRQGKEFIYPILIELLNHIQSKTGKPVIVTSGHRCPEHNSYVDSGKENFYSKHMMGAEVSFYVQGLEEDPYSIVLAILGFYADASPEYRQFLRYDKSTNVRTQPWYNKEIFVKIFDKDEGRNLDNRHPYPYISIQVRFDRDLSEKVIFNWDQAHKNYLRK